MSTGHSRKLVTCLCGILVWFGVATCAAPYARLNLDEPWYLTASYEVIHGFAPYRDFAYTQGPLLPYVYGASLSLLGLGLETGRFVSIWFSTLAVALALSLTYRMGGHKASAMTLFLLLITPGVVYYLVIVKTFALVAFLALLALALTFQVPSRNYAWVPFVSSFAAVGAAAVRISFVPLAILVLLYWLWRGYWKQSLFGSACVMLTVLAVASRAGDNWLFDLVQFHALREGLSGQAAVSSKLNLTVQMTILFAPLIFVILLAALIWARAPDKRMELIEWWKKHRAAKSLWLLSVIVLWIVQWGAWANYWEYEIPVCFVLIPLLASIGPVLMEAPGRRIVYLALLGACLVVAAVPGWFFQGMDEWESTNVLGLSNRQSGALARAGRAGDLVLGAFNQLALEAELGIVPGNEMGKFSVSAEMTSDQARSRRFLTVTDVTNLLNQCVPTFIITDPAGKLFEISIPSLQPIAPADQTRWEELLARSYRPVYADDHNIIFRRQDGLCGMRP